MCLAHLTGLACASACPSAPSALEANRGLARARRGDRTKPGSDPALLPVLVIFLLLVLSTPLHYISITSYSAAPGHRSLAGPPQTPALRPRIGLPLVSHRAQYYYYYYYY